MVAVVQHAVPRLIPQLGEPRSGWSAAWPGRTARFVSDPLTKLALPAAPHPDDLAPKQHDRDHRLVQVDQSLEACPTTVPPSSSVRPKATGAAQYGLVPFQGLPLLRDAAPVGTLAECPNHLAQARARPYVWNGLQRPRNVEATDGSGIPLSGSHSRGAPTVADQPEQLPPLPDELTSPLSWPPVRLMSVSALPSIGAFGPTRRLAEIPCIRQVRAVLSPKIVTD